MSLFYAPVPGRLNGTVQGTLTEGEGTVQLASKRKFCVRKIVIMPSLSKAADLD
jgi:hypothetical protein